MADFIFFTKTMWDEPPRIRHQLANLLASKSHKILFFQKPTPATKKPKEEKKITNQISITQTRELIHHQLRIHPLISEITSKFESRQIREASQKIKEPIIINFNYDYYFLRDIFKKNKIITIINDDFISQSKFFSGRHVKQLLCKTCQASDLVLTVSHPLVAQLSSWCAPKLFLPWADSAYTPPSQNPERRSILIWASINEVIDYDLVEKIAKEMQAINFKLYGPISKNVASRVAQLCAQNPNITYSAPQQLENIPLDDFFASLMPYKSHIKSTEAVTLANKSFRLMSKGLPLVVHGMPYFYEHEAIHKCKNAAEIATAIDKCLKGFHQIQEPIRQLIDKNQANDRYEYLQSLIRTL